MRSQAVNTFTNRSNHKCQALVWDFKAPATERNFQVSIFFSSSSIKTYSEHGSNQLMVARTWFSVIQSSHSPTKCRDDEWDVQSAKQLGDLPTLSSQDNEVSQDQPMQTQKWTFPQSLPSFCTRGWQEEPTFCSGGESATGGSSTRDSVPSSKSRRQHTRVNGGGTSLRKVMASRRDFPNSCTPFTCVEQEHTSTQRGLKDNHQII